MLLLLVLAMGLIVFSAIFSISEASLFSYSISKGRVRAANGSWLAKNAVQVRENPTRVIAVLVILSTTLNIVGSIIIGTLAARQFSSQGIGIFSTILTFLTITLAEILPKNFGERWNQAVFPVVAYPLRLLSIVFLPIVYILEQITKPFTSGISPFMTSEEEIALLTRVGADEGVIEKQEAEMIQRVFRLNDITAGDMMTPKPFVLFIDGSKSIGEQVSTIKSMRHSRLPVFDGNENNVIGLVHQRDLLRALADGEMERKVSEYAHEVLIVPESRIADDLLRDFQEKRSHLAVVVSEYGNIVGVVGLEDVLEELVGEIIDEKDVIPELIKRISKNEIIVHGQTRIINLNRFFNTNISSKKTVNGFLIEQFQRIPEKNEILELNELTFRVDEVGPRQIDRVHVIKN